MNSSQFGMGDYLRSYGLIGFDVHPYHASTRDRRDIPVLKCEQTDVIFLDDVPFALDIHYRDKQVENDGKQSLTNIDGAQISTSTLQDSQRRFEDFRDLLKNRTVCDFGTGHGLFMRYSKDEATEICGVELNALHVNRLRADGFRVEQNIEAYNDNYFDLVTLFHVLEHLRRPIETLQVIRGRMKPGAKLIVEVPHARDFLHWTLGSEAFKNFTFWSEHLVLHTSDSLRRTLQLAGFRNVVVKGYQRYGLENHLHWLVKQKPGGHEAWAYLSGADMNRSYAQMLQAIGQTDTLLSFAEA